MQASSPTTAGFPPAGAVRFNPRVVTAIAVVLLVHAALIVIALTMREKPLPKPVELRSITAELLSPPAPPVAAPAAIQSTPTPPPKPTPPVHHEKPKVQPRPTHVVKSTPAPTPLPEAAAPSQHEIAAPEPAPPAPPAPAAPAEPAAPAAGKPTLALSAPKSVSHLDCSITAPDYPALSRRRGESGTAYVRFVVGLTGKIENIELKKSSGFDRLDDAAMSAMRSSSCKPYLENGQPIRATYTQPFEFGLKD
ncbi:energy transducer TonB [Paraburkholderia rhizosphaerae]|uniref:Outer membrane transport energization protein TonB n=1 Tax=Paraburkholderia rhizosphaerae TaxID=480658 RepID=A0A4V6QCW3_9BURK|nr:energy transducer TonB [Paraburkholderia rhizosphaerae]TDY38944.1 outer membrane transport energization protein TonB [Paraburkholderia rhizosphaerae]